MPTSNALTRKLCVQFAFLSGRRRRRRFFHPQACAPAFILIVVNYTANAECHSNGDESNGYGLFCRQTLSTSSSAAALRMINAAVAIVAIIIIIMHACMAATTGPEVRLNAPRPHLHTHLFHRAIVIRLNLLQRILTDRVNKDHDMIFVNVLTMASALGCCFIP